MRYCQLCRNFRDDASTLRSEGTARTAQRAKCVNNRLMTTARAAATNHSPAPVVLRPVIGCRQQVLARPRETASSSTCWLILHVCVCR